MRIQIDFGTAMLAPEALHGAVERIRALPCVILNMSPYAQVFDYAPKSPCCPREMAVNEERSVGFGAQSDPAALKFWRPPTPTTYAE